MRNTKATETEKTMDAKGKTKKGAKGAKKSTPPKEKPKPKKAKASPPRKDKATRATPRTRNPPSAEAAARKNAVKREKYARGKFDVVAVYLDKTLFNVVEKERKAQKGSSRSGIIKAAIVQAYAPNLVLDKPTRSSDVGRSKTTSRRKTKNVKTTRARSTKLPTV